MNKEWENFYSAPRRTSAGRAHVLVSAVEYRPGMWEATCSCKASFSPIDSESGCERVVLVHREVESTLAITVPGYER